MGGRRASRVPALPRAVIAAAVGAMALVASGCGVEEHANDPRPQPPTRVSVAVTDSGITVQPSRIAVAPEPDQQIPQNRNTEQPVVDTDAPLDVVLVAANLTDVDSRLEVRGNGESATSRLLVANGNISMLTSLPTGVYLVSAADHPNLKPARLAVGPRRTSSENDLLLP